MPFVPLAGFLLLAKVLFLDFLSLFQAFEEAGLLHRAFLVLLELRQELFFVHGVTEKQGLGDGNDHRDEVVVRQTRCIAVEDEHEHDGHQVHHGLHARHLFLARVCHIHIELRVGDVRNGH